MHPASVGVDTRSPVAGRPTDDGCPTWFVVVTLVGLGAALPLFLAWQFGALGIPRGDDAAYIGSAFRFFDDGTLNGEHWASMNLVGQLVAAVPVIAVVGRRVSGLQVETALIGVVGLWATFDLARRILSARRSLFVAALAAANPMWLLLAPTFSTDIPAFTFGMASLALGARALTSHTRRGWLLAASLAVGLAGFTIRETVIVAPIAVGVVAFVVERRSKARFRPLVGLSVLAVLAVAFATWRHGLPGFVVQPLHRPTSVTIRVTITRLTRSLLLLGLLVVPAVLLAGPANLVRTAWDRARRTTVTAIAALVALVTVEYVAIGHSAQFLAPDRLVSNQWTIVESWRPLVPQAIAPLLALVGIASVGLLLCAAIPPVTDAIARAREGATHLATSPVQSLVALAATALAASYIATSLVGYVFFFRYSLPIVPLVAILVLSARAARRPAGSSATVLAVVAFGALAAIGIVSAATNNSFDGAAWSVTRGASRVVGSPSLVDGGFAWNTWRSGDAESKSGPRACVDVTVESEPPIGPSLVSSERVWTIGNELWITARQTRECP